MGYAASAGIQEDEPWPPIEVVEVADDVVLLPYPGVRGRREQKAIAGMDHAMTGEMQDLGLLVADPVHEFGPGGPIHSVNIDRTAERQEMMIDLSHFTTDS
jgi:hypothetical protein